MNNNHIGIIGGGSWATAIVKILLEDPQRRLRWWVRSEEACEGIMRGGHNPLHLSNVGLDSSRIEVSTRLDEVVSGSSHLLLSIPSAHLHQTLSQLPAGSLWGKKVVSSVKGSVPDCCLSVSLYLEHCMGVAKEDICIVSGPTHAEEVGLEMPTFLTFASVDRTLADTMQSIFSCRYVHSTVSDDMDGIERCGLAKNIYAIAAGICQGLGYGDNLCAVLTAAAAHEIRRALDKYHPCADRNFESPCYLGDLIVTCWSAHSRNRALGQAVAKGATPQQYFAEKGVVAEGYYSAKNLHSRATADHTEADIPIAEAVYRILYEGADPRTEICSLIKHAL